MPEDDTFDIDYDIDDLMEPENKERNLFAKSVKQISPEHKSTFQYEVLGQMFDYGGEKNEIIGQKYNELKKGKEAHIEFMTPADYFKEIGQDIDLYKNGTRWDEAHEMKERTNKLRDMARRNALNNTKFAMPYIQYDDGVFKGTHQEGRHRAFLADQMGIERIPVVKINRKNGPNYTEENEYAWQEWRQNYKKKKNPFTYDKEDMWDVDY